MKRVDYSILLLSLLFGLSVWFIDALIDYFFHYRSQYTFSEILLTDIPGHDIFTRIAVTVLFLFFALILIRK